MVTNVSKKVLYCGVTNNLKTRVYEHEQDSKGEKKHFAGKYNCYHLVFYERFQNVNQAINRETEIKGWSRKKKEELINTMNPGWNFLNDQL